MDLRKSTRGNSQAGNTLIFVLLALGTFLFGVVGFAVDYSNLWHHRQTVQAAADSACQAAAMDGAVLYTNGTWIPGTAYTWGTAFTCGSGNHTASPCAYAILNGYNSSSSLTAGTAGSQVKVSFPSSFAGYTFPTGYTPPANPFVKVDITDRANVFFSRLFTGNATVDVGGTATCGIIAETSAVPIVVLAPTGSSLHLQGHPSITITGGPQRSVQVNSNATNAVSIGGSASLTLTNAGPDGTGGDLANFGSGQTTNPGASLGTTGQYIDPAPPISDPFANLPSLAKPTIIGTTVTVTPGITSATKDANCPTGTSSCTRYNPGYYASGINISGVALFVNGAYYLDGDLTMGSHTNIRPADFTLSPPDVNAPDGMFFYFANGAGVNIGANSGGTLPAYTGAITCPGGPIPTTTPSLTGTLFLAPCSGPYKDPSGYRGVLFMHDRASSGTIGMGGGGDMSYIGDIYFHDNSYSSQITTSGNSSGSTFVLGDIVTDSIQMGGTSGISMELNPAASWYTLRVALLQ